MYYKLLVFPLCVIVAASCLYLLPASAADDPLTMGVFPRRNAKVTMKLFNPIAKYLSRKLGREVELVISKDFESFWEGVTEQRYDLVHYNQYHYLESHKKYGYQVIAKNEEFGSSRISGVITIRVDSGIRSVLDLKGKKIVFGGGPKAMMSYIVPTYLLREGGLRAGDYEEAFARNPPNAILSAYFRQSAAAGAGRPMLRSSPTL
jgi:phosphonate transport system substrate-binding protein